MQTLDDLIVVGYPGIAGDTLTATGGTTHAFKSCMGDLPSPIQFDP